MSENSKTQELAEFFEETGHSHHKAFIATDGFDPDWALWYAEFMLERVRSILEADLTQSDVVYLLVWLSREHPLVAPGSPWPRFYARTLVQRYGHGG